MYAFIYVHVYYISLQIYQGQIIIKGMSNMNTLSKNTIFDKSKQQLKCH